MSIIDAFDDQTDAIIHPSQISPPIDGFPKVAAVSFGEHTIAALKDHYDTRLIGYIQACVVVPIYEITFQDRKIAVYCSTLGGPATVGIMEEMISKGCEKFVFFGSCGVLDREVAAKSLVVPTDAYRDEGVSYHYAPPADYIKVNTAPKLSAIFSALNLPHVCGKTWTTDAFYRETRGNMEKRKAEGCITVDMECASIMAAAWFRGVEAYQFFYAADSLDAVEWDARTLGKLPQTSREKFLRAALETAARV
jgi:uridine phosphorylase